MRPGILYMVGEIFLYRVRFIVDNESTDENMKNLEFLLDLFHKVQKKISKFLKQKNGGA